MFRTLVILGLSLGLSLSAADSAIAVMSPTAGNQTAGTITFEAVAGGVLVTATISGLQPDSAHAFHVHEFGDLRSEDGSSAGGHYNPEGHDHGLPGQEHRHAGDFGNLQADGQGMATMQLVVDNITIDGEHNPVIGRGMIIHAGPDDGSQPTGAAGARIAIGVIGYAQHEDH